MRFRNTSSHRKRVKDLVNDINEKCYGSMHGAIKHELGSLAAAAQRSPSNSFLDNFDTFSYFKAFNRYFEKAGYIIASSFLFHPSPKTVGLL